MDGFDDFSIMDSVFFMIGRCVVTSSQTRSRLVAEGDTVQLVLTAGPDGQKAAPDAGTQGESRFASGKTGRGEWKLDFDTSSSLVRFPIAVRNMCWQ